MVTPFVIVPMAVSMLRVIVIVVALLAVMLVFFVRIFGGFVCHSLVPYFSKNITNKPRRQSSPPRTPLS